MLPTTEGVQHLHTLLGQAVWFTQHLELVLSRYIALLKLQRRQDRGEIISEDDILKTLSMVKSQSLEKSFESLRGLAMITQEAEAEFRRFLTEKDWVLHESIVDDLISFRNPETKKHFYGLIEAYIGEARNRKLAVLNEIETWFEGKGYDLSRVSLIVGELP